MQILRKKDKREMCETQVQRKNQIGAEKGRFFDKIHSWRMVMKIKAYLIDFTSKQTGVRYLCYPCAEDVVHHKKEAGIRFMTRIHSDVYDKKCHMCKRKK